ncbi:MAG: DUF2142 domain-containing protein [Caldilineaceae bacterium]|nr:DUF2142 domain-containing protein [Caldilineaceae bacterium]MDE0338875.1 DUF2142 domain-containing protein [Caldilineaceae bacterium]
MEKALVALLLSVFLLTGIAYSLVVPPFETPDEIYHYAFARHLAAGNGLPVQGPEMTGPWEQEGSQPPLYYSLVALMTAGIDQSGLDAFAVRNPRANLGDPHQQGNKNYMLFSAESRPLIGANLALHMGRWISVVLGTFTVLFSYLLARFAFPADRWARLLATAMVATIPQFSFISASVSNDIMVTVVSAAALVWLAAICSSPWDREIRRWEWIGLGLLLGLGALSKLQGLGLLPLTAFVVLKCFGRNRDWNKMLRGTVQAGCMVLIVAGWWYARNLYLYGDLFGTTNLLSVTGQRVETLSIQGLFGELRGLQMSFWGIFGWFSILLPPWVYSLFELLTALAVSGAIIALIRNLKSERGPGAKLEQSGNTLGIAWIWILISLALLGYWISVALGSQGRLLFPAITALALVAVTGLRFWAGFLPRAGRIGLGIIVPLGLWSCSAFALVELLPESYGLGNAAGSVDELPADATPIGRVYGDGVELVAARLPGPDSFDGDSVPLTLYFRAMQQQEQDLELFIHLLDAFDRQIGNVTSHPGWGARPLTLWQPGLIYEDSYQIPLDRPSPNFARFVVGFVDPSSTALESEGLLPVAGGGPRIESRVIWTHYEQLEPITVRYEGGISLVGAALGQGDIQHSTGQLIDIAQGGTLWVAMRWQETVDSDTEYATSLRLRPVKDEGSWVHQEDSKLWKPVSSLQANATPGALIDSLVRLELPEELPGGEYELQLVIYDAETLRPVVQDGTWEPELLLARLRLN